MLTAIRRGREWGRVGPDRCADGAGVLAAIRRGRGWGMVGPDLKLCYLGYSPIGARVPPEVC